MVFPPRVYSLLVSEGVGTTCVLTAVRSVPGEIECQYLLITLCIVGGHGLRTALAHAHAVAIACIRHQKPAICRLHAAHAQIGIQVFVCVGITTRQPGSSV